MFDQKNPANVAAVDAAWAILEDRERGDLVDHEDIEKALGVRRPRARYYSLMEMVKKRLLDDRDIVLVSVMGVGYTLATPIGQLGFAHNRVRRARRQTKKAAVLVRKLPAGECSLAEQRTKILMEDRIALTDNSLKQDARTLDFFLRPRDSMPTRPKAWQYEDAMSAS